jgi:hypothetical protein
MDQWVLSRKPSDLAYSGLAADAMIETVISIAQM